MHTYGHIHISEIAKISICCHQYEGVKYCSALYIKTIIKHTFNGEKRNNIAAYTFEKFIWAILGVAYVTLFCINHKVFFIIIVRLI